MVDRRGRREIGPVSGTLAWLGSVLNYAVTTSVLGAIERFIGALEQRRRVIGSTEPCDAYRDREFHTVRTALDGKRLACHSPPQPFRHDGAHRKVGFRHHDNEFLAAIPAGKVDATDRLAQP